MENSFQEQPVTIFNDYFVEQWLEPAEMVSMWCCYNERHRSTNLVEAWNQRLQRYTGKKPSLLLLLQTITNDISTHDIAQERFRTGGVSVHNRKKRSISNDEMIALLTEQRKEEIPIGHILEKISNIVTIKHKT